MLAQGAPFELLAHHTVQPPAGAIGQHHAVELRLGIGALGKSLQLATWPCQGNGGLASRSFSREAFTGRLHEAFKSVGVFLIAMARLLSGALQRDREELLVVTPLPRSAP